jgi:protein involved in polysaccharide export with SLBB domain
LTPRRALAVRPFPQVRLYAEDTKMTLAVVMSRALDGLEAPAVRVEVHLANGLPSFTLVGLADTEVKEARERVRAALSESGFAFPHNQRVTVNLAPADLPKESGRFDLPIALGILAASGVIDPARLQGLEVAGELSLAGALQPVRGALALALAARREQTTRTLVLPAASAAEAALVQGLEVRQATHLLEVAQTLMPSQEDAVGIELPRAVAQRPAQARENGPDLAEVRGQAAARRALEIAAAGQHSLLLIGPPGTPPYLKALRDKQVAIQAQTVASFAIALLHGHQRTYFSPQAALEGVARGEASAALVWGPVAGWQLKQQPALALLLAEGDAPPPGLSWNLHVATRTEDAALRDMIDRTLAELAADGSLVRLAGQYGIPWRAPFAVTYSLTELNKLR